MGLQHCVAYIQKSREQLSIFIFSTLSSSVFEGNLILHIRHYEKSCKNEKNTVVFVVYILNETKKTTNMRKELYSDLAT